MWIFDKLFNRKIEGKSSLDDLAENVVVNKETNTTEVGGNLNVNGTITQNAQPLGGGTKLYKHYLSDDGAGYYFILITTNPQSIDFSTIDTYKKLCDYLLTQNVIQFVEKYGSCIQYDDTNNIFYTIRKTGNTTSIALYDDWGLSQTTDTVNEL